MAKGDLWAQRAAEAAAETKKKQAPTPPSEDRRQLGTYLPVGLHRRLKLFAAREDRQVQDIVADALTAYLDEHE